MYGTSSLSFVIRSIHNNVPDICFPLYNGPYKRVNESIRRFGILFFPLIFIEHKSSSVCVHFFSEGRGET